jgi:peptidylprolyl isomerase/peptidyl-prolyl cis-trans isomerase D
MAILSEIRERSMFLIVIIGLALFAFVASPKDILDFFNSSKVNAVGEVNGESISRTDFAAKVEAYKSNAGATTSEMQAVNAVWNGVLSERIYKDQLSKAGIVVGEKDVWDAIVSNPNIQNAAIFKNEIGSFDEDKFKEYLSNLKESSKEASNTAWANWLANEKNIKTNLEKQAYNQLVKLGIGASLKEGQRNYIESQTKMSGSLVYLPFNGVDAKEITVSSEEIASYVNEHAKEFEVAASRDIKFVKFDIVASPEDEEALKNELKFEIEPFKTAKNSVEYATENGTDIPVDAKYAHKNNLPTVVADAVFAANKGAVVGPYKFQNHLRISKIEEIIKMPDSVKASHILVSFAGSRAADATVTRTEAEAKKLADSILNVVQKRKSKFSSLAKKFSADKSNADKGGQLDWFTYTQMVPEFRDYVFLNKKGSMGVVKTIFGYHIVKIDAQKNIQKAVQLTTIAREIDASESTENEIFENAETLAYNLSSGKNLKELKKENNYNVRPLFGLSELDEDIAGLGKNRSIVRWAFDTDRNVNDVKRFDLDKGYAVVVVTNKTEKGLMSTVKASSKVKSILINEKKAALLLEKMEGDDLASVAKTNDANVQSFANITPDAPTISGVGIEPGVVGAMYATETGAFQKGVIGKKGVFAFVVDSKEAPEVLTSYEGAKNSLSTANQNAASAQIYKALEEASAVQDHRALMY